MVIDIIVIGCSDLGLKLQGKLKVTVVKAGLKSQDRIGKSDPYVRLYVRVLFKKKTTTKDSNLNPEWNESFEFDVEDTETQTLVLQVSVSELVLSDNFSSCSLDGSLSVASGKHTRIHQFIANLVSLFVTYNT